MGQDMKLYERTHLLSSKGMRLFLVHYPHVIEGDKKLGIAVVIEEQPIDTVEDRARAYVAEYIANHGI